MRIDAITACSGKGYASILEKSLPIWLDTLDSLTVVCKPTDDKVIGFAGPSNLKIVTTDVFDKYEAKFNKGAALGYAYAAADPSDWCLHFDSDITPPENWRDAVDKGHSKNLKKPIHVTRITPSVLEKDRLYGVPRILNDRRQTLNYSPSKFMRFQPYGYFQLWHTSCRVTYRWPLFENYWGHCGCYDMEFIALWGLNKCSRLNFTVHHQGEIRRNWFGEEHSEEIKLLLKEGLKKYRFRVKGDIEKHCPIPKPKANLVFSCHKPDEWLREALRICREGGPFGVTAKLEDIPEDQTTLTLDAIRGIVHGQ